MGVDEESSSKWNIDSSYLHKKIEVINIRSNKNCNDNLCKWNVREELPIINWNILSIRTNKRTKNTSLKIEIQK